MAEDETTVTPEPKYLYNPDMKLVKQFDFLRDNIRPARYEDKAIAKAMEELYDAIVPVMQGYLDTLASDHPLVLYVKYFTRDSIDIMEDETEEPVLYATVPFGSEAIMTKVGPITPLTTVRITSASKLGDVGITRNLEAERGATTRVFWDSLVDYRTTAVKEVKTDGDL